MIDRAAGLVPVATRVDAGQMRNALASLKLALKTPGGIAYKRFEPDYLCFINFAMNVLGYVSHTHSDADRADFATLVGKLIPAGKDRVALQAADLLCWYTHTSQSLSETDQRRYASLSRRCGILETISQDELIEFARRAQEADIDLEEELSAEP